MAWAWTDDTRRTDKIRLTPVRGVFAWAWVWWACVLFAGGVDLWASALSRGASTSGPARHSRCVPASRAFPHPPAPSRSRGGGGGRGRPGGRGWVAARAGRGWVPAGAGQAWVPAGTVGGCGGRARGWKRFWAAGGRRGGCGGGRWPAEPAPGLRRVPASRAMPPAGLQLACRAHPLDEPCRLPARA